MSGTDHVNERTLDLVRKLLRLADDPSNQYEAALAAERAHDLLTKHKLSMADVEARGEAVAEEYERDPFYVGSGYDRKWREHLIQCVTKYNYCTVIYRSGKPGHAWIIGKPSDVDVCEYLFDYLSRTIARLSGQTYIQARLDNRYAVDHDADGVRVKPSLWKREFAWGCVYSISDRLKDARKREMEDAPTQALVVVVTQQLKDATDRLIGETRDIITRARYGHDGAMQLGKEAGKRIPISPGVRGPATRMPLKGGVHG